MVEFQRRHEPSRLRAIATLDQSTIATRLEPAGRRDATALVPGGGTSLLFVHVALPAGADLPERLVHRLEAQVSAAPLAMR
jgi:hypothetical protein